MKSIVSSLLKSSLCFLSATLLLSGCSLKKKEPLSKTDFVLNTVATITLYDTQDPQIIEDAFDLCRQYERKLSSHLDTSEISTMNHRSEEEMSFPLDSQLQELLNKSSYYNKLSQGGFDVTIGAISTLWDFTSEDFKLPKDEDIQNALPSVGFQNITLSNQEITFHRQDTQLDLGAIAKGFIADKVKEQLVKQGVTSAVINLGGNILCIGTLPDGNPFKIGLQKPFAERSETIGTLKINDMTVVSSGVYERHHILDGVNYHHLLNPKTGYPLNNGLTSVSIITKYSVDGDGLSTTAFSLGLLKGMELINSLPDTYAVFITEDGSLHYSEGFEDFLIQK